MAVASRETQNIVHCTCGLRRPFSGAGDEWGAEQKMERVMKAKAIKLAVAFALLGAFATGTAAFMLGGTAPAAAGCIPQYDTTGAQIAPYC